MDERFRITPPDDGGECHWAIQLYEHLIALNDGIEAPITRDDLPEEE